MVTITTSPSVTDKPRDGAREAGPEPGPGPGGRAETGTTTTTRRPGMCPGIRLTVAITILKCYRAIATGYLPAAADDYEYDDLAGYSSDSASTRGQNSALPGYSAEPQPGYEADSRDLAQSQYGEEDITTTESPDTRDLEEEASGDSAGESYGGPDSADDQYGAPSNVDLTRAAPDDNYGAPGTEESGVSLARASDTDYAAPGEYEAPSYEAGNGFPFEAVESRSGPGGQPGEPQCPGGSIEQCVGVCPGSSVRVYGACVGGCADRCPENN